MSKRPIITKLASRGLLARFRAGSGSLPGTILISHFVAVVRLIILGVLVVVVALVVQVIFTPHVIDSNAARIVELETQLLEQVTDAVKARRQELPETVVGNRREYFTVRR